MNRIAVFLFLIILAFMAGNVFADGNGMASIGIVENQPDDPFDQLMDIKHREDRGDVLRAVLVVLVVVLSGLAWYALSERTTKFLKAQTAFSKQRARAARNPAPRPPSAARTIASERNFTADQWLDF